MRVVYKPPHGMHDATLLQNLSALAPVVWIVRLAGAQVVRPQLPHSRVIHGRQPVGVEQIDVVLPQLQHLLRRICTLITHFCLRIDSRTDSAARTLIPSDDGNDLQQDCVEAV
jgi:hypothetical protein